jgi:hypothetical protein
LAKYGVRELIVADWLPHPSVPEDAEVILVAADGGALPEGIFLGITEVGTSVAP